MATIEAFSSFNIADIDFSRLHQNQTGRSFSDNIDQRFQGETYRDVYSLDWFARSNDFRSLMMGDDLTVNGGGRLTGGTINAYSERLWTGSDFYELWRMTGVSVSAAELDAAMRTRGDGDDFRLIQSALSGSDRFDLSADADFAHGLGGNDLLLGRGGGDVLAGGPGADTLSGQAGADHLFLDGGADLLLGGKGQDWVHALRSKDSTIRLGSDNGQNTGFGIDTIRGVENAEGAQGDDRLFGNGKSNQLNGAAGDDLLVGNGGADRLDGGRGNDDIRGGGGRDLMAGGGGADRFVFVDTDEIGTRGANSDVIIDFRQGTDLIDLRRVDAADGIGGNNKFLWRGDEGIGTASGGEIAWTHLDRAGTDRDVTLIRIDTDDDSAAEAVLRLTGLYDLTAADFVL